MWIILENNTLFYPFLIFITYFLPKIEKQH